MSNLTSINNQSTTQQVNKVQSRSGNTTENGTPIIMPGQETDKELFLKMLVAQMQNQDPFSPQDPTQYVTQLAQFTMLEQTMTLNSNMEYLMGMTNGLLVNSAMSGASSLIGKNIEAYAPVESEGTEGTEGDVESGEDDTENDSITGVVESVHIKDGVVYMNVKDDKTGEIVEIEYAALIKVSNESLNPDENTNVDTDTEIEEKGE